MLLMNRFLAILIFLSTAILCSGQSLFGVSSKWDDSFREWAIFTEDEEQEGELMMRWPFREDWTEWEYQLEDFGGDIRQQWKNDPSKWQISGDGERITARRLWANSNREWRITNNSTSLTLRSKYGNDFGSWQIREETYGKFEMFTDIEGDPRDWVIVDEMDEEISLAFKMAIVFIVLHHSTPRL